MKPRSQSWTQAEDALLREKRPFFTHAELVQFFPGCTENALRHRISILGLSPRRRWNQKWTQEEVAELIRLYTRHTGERGGWLKAFAGKIGRSPGNIVKKAKSLGLKTSYFRKAGFRSLRIIEKMIRQSWTPKQWHEYRSQLAKDRLAKNGHPRGFAGHKHSVETRRKLSEAGKKSTGGSYSKTRRARMASSQRMSELLREHPSSVYSRSHGGRRVDLGNQYFRSSYEANYARFLNFQHIQWEYEARTFWFEKIKRGSRSYTPDFWLPIAKEYHEVKGWMDQKSQTKLKRMAKYYPDVKVILIDGHWFKDAERKGICLIIPGWECKHTEARKAWDSALLL